MPARKPGPNSALSGPAWPRLSHSRTLLLHTLRLADGRTLAYDIYGDPDGLPVIFSHGFADSRVIRNPDEDLTRSLGVRMIAADQPGVGGSSPRPGRRIVDWGADMEQLADHLGLGQFAVAGGAGHYGFVDRERWSAYLGALTAPWDSPPV